MKSKLIVILSISQLGKDYYARHLMEDMQKTAEIFGKEIKIRYANAYKVRNKRENDPEHIHCVDAKEKIPKAFDIQSTIFGSQTIAYSSSEIATSLQNSESLVICTTSVELFSKLQEKFPDETVSILILGGVKSLKRMQEEEAKRYNKPLDDTMIVESATKRYTGTAKQIEQLEAFYGQADYTLFNRYSVSPYADPHGDDFERSIRSLGYDLLKDMGFYEKKCKNGSKKSEDEGGLQ